MERQKITSIDRWFKEVMAMTREKGQERKYMRIVVAMTWWQIWKERCRKIFQKKNPDPWRSIRKIQKDIVELMALEGNVKRDNGKNEGKEEEKWEKPEKGWMKINCDGAYKAKGNEDRGNNAGIGVVIRDETRRMCSGVAKKVRVKSNLEAKVAAVREGIVFAEALSIPKIIMETDIENLCKAIIRSNKEGEWRVQPYVADILGKKACFEEIKFVKIRRSANKAADWLAQQVKKGMCLSNWVYVPHSLWFIF